MSIVKNFCGLGILALLLSPAVAAADPVARFQHGAGIARLAQLIGGGEPGDAGAQDDYPRAVPAAGE